MKFCLSNSGTHIIQMTLAVQYFQVLRVFCRKPKIRPMDITIATWVSLVLEVFDLIANQLSGFHPWVRRQGQPWKGNWMPLMKLYPFLWQQLRKGKVFCLFVFVTSTFVSRGQSHVLCESGCEQASQNLSCSQVFIYYFRNSDVSNTTAVFHY